MGLIMFFIDEQRDCCAKLYFLCIFIFSKFSSEFLCITESQSNHCGCLLGGFPHQ